METQIPARATLCAAREAQMRQGILLFLVGAAALSQAGCAERLFEASVNACNAMGYPQNTLAWSDCVQAENARRTAQFQRGLDGLARAAQPPAQTYTAPTGGGTAQGAAFLKGSYVSGMNRICVYNRLGSEVAYTIGAAQICPLTLN